MAVSQGEIVELNYELPDGKFSPQLALRKPTPRRCCASGQQRSRQV